MSDIIRNKKQFKKGWKNGMPETPCGLGSTLSETEKQRKWIPEILKKYDIHSIADIGAGDLNWIAHTDLNGCEYTAYAPVPRKKEVIKFDITKEVPPKVDLIICLWVLNHLPKKESQKAIQNIKNSGAKYLMMTDRPRWHKEQPDEIHMAHIEWIILNKKRDNIKLIKL